MKLYILVGIIVVSALLAIESSLTATLNKMDAAENMINSKYCRACQLQ